MPFVIEVTAAEQPEKMYLTGKSGPSWLSPKKEDAYQYETTLFVDCAVRALNANPPNNRPDLSYEWVEA